MALDESFYDDQRKEAARRGCKIVHDCTPEEVVEAANDEHIWINAFSLIHPTDKLLLDVGRSVVGALRRSKIVDDLNGMSPHAYIHINAS